MSVDLRNPAYLLPQAFADKKGDSSSMHLSPAVLLNYRLWCLATHERLGEPEIRDIEPLCETFKHDLRKHRREINVKFARVATRTHPGLKEMLWRQIGVELEKGKEVQPWGEEEEEEREEELPPYDPGWSNRHERELASGMGGMGLSGKEPAPRYEAGPSQQYPWDKKQ
jgi:hypothetical protein